MSLIVEGFVVENLIKEGGFAGVYLAKKVSDKKNYAIKALIPRICKETSAKTSFAREIKLMTKFDHPYIVKVEGPAINAQRPAMVMEYFESETLYELIVNKSPLIEQKGLGIFRKICQALMYIHDQKIIHKDIKPENILVSANGDVRLIDFSIAEKLSIMSALRKRKREGTPLYMSPEQIKKQPLDARTDIFSAGASFYRAFTGEPHVTADSEKALLQNILRLPIKKVRHLNKAVPYQIENIIMRMLRKKVEDRYQSMQEVLFDLKKFTQEDYLVKPK